MSSETPPPVFARVSSNGDEPPRSSRRTFADLRALDLALARADLPAARAAFDRLQQDSAIIANAVSRDPFPMRTRPLRALRLLGRCLLRGNLPGARSAFEAFC